MVVTEFVGECDRVLGFSGRRRPVRTIVVKNDERAVQDSASVVTWWNVFSERISAHSNTSLHLNPHLPNVSK